MKLLLLVTMSYKKRYAIVGVGSRSEMFWRAIATTYQKCSELVAICDVNSTRMNRVNRILTEECGMVTRTQTYKASEFQVMIETHRPDTIIVTTVDATHHYYIIQAMEMGCDVITEKPMTIDEKKCQQILNTVKRTGKNLRVTFNYRYSPLRSKVKELIRDGIIGDVKQIHFEWLLDTQHGADYFRRWHRDKRNSGGLMVHKSTHHFDLVNWWMDTKPEMVFGMGALSFYGKANADQRGVSAPYFRTTGADAAKEDPFALDLSAHKNLKEMYLDAEHEDGYIRDHNVFSDGISIEDTMNVLVRYQNGAQMSYSLSAFNPWEGYRVMFTGTKGRIELQDVEKSYVSGDGKVMGESLRKGESILVCPQFDKPYEVEPAKAEGGHGGGDIPLLRDLFSEKNTSDSDPLGHAANHEDGAWSILTGIAANLSFATGKAVRPASLITF